MTGSEIQLLRKASIVRETGGWLRPGKKNSSTLYAIFSDHHGYPYLMCVVYVLATLSIFRSLPLSLFLCLSGCLPVYLCHFL